MGTQIPTNRNPKQKREGGELRTRQTLKENQVGRTEKKYLRAKQNYLQPGLVRVSCAGVGLSYGCPSEVAAVPEAARGKIVPGIILRFLRKFSEFLPGSQIPR